MHFTAELNQNALANCTATLVHPRMITLAAHCVDEGTPNEVFFGDTTDHDGPGRRVGVKSCHQKGGQQADEDFAYCILAEPVNDVSIIPILYGCELDFLQEGEQVVLVGFGNIDEDTPSPNGHKRWVEAPIQKVERKTIDLGESGHSNCFGDSGGPAYLQLPDGSWRVLGATSSSYVVDGVACAHEGTWALTPYYVPWIEETSGLDVTPCYDSAGKWEAGPECTGFPLNPDESTGTWQQMCRQTEKLSKPSSTCGEAWQAGGAGGAGGTGGTGGSAGAGGVGGAGLSGGGISGSAGSGGANAGSSGSAVAGSAVVTTQGGSAGALGMAGSSGSPLPPLGVATSSGDTVVGGCGCRVPHGPPGSGGAGALLGLLLLKLRRRSALPGEHLGEPQNRGAGTTGRKPEAPTDESHGIPVRRPASRV